MPRKPRSIELGATYHLISRFVDREWFIKSSMEREHYLRLLGHALERSDWRLMSYAVMSNHIHFAARAGSQPLSEWIRRVHAPFADAMNRAYGRIGPMFVRGPKAFIVSPQSFPHLLAYIHNNPVRAGLCANAAGSSWTSHRAYIGQARAPSWLHIDEGLARAGFDDRHAFDAWVKEPARAETDVNFTETHYRQVEQDARDADRLADLSHQSSVTTAIVAATAELLGISLEQLCSSARTERELTGRAIAARCATALGVSGRAIAGALQLSQQRVSLLCRQPSSIDLERLCAQVVAVVKGDESESRSCSV